MLRDLLVHVDGSDGGRRRVKLAVGLAHASTLASPDSRHAGADIEPLYRPSLVDACCGPRGRKLMQDARNAATIFHEEPRGFARTKWVEAGAMSSTASAPARYADMVFSVNMSSRIRPTPSLPIAHSAV